MATLAGYRPSWLRRDLVAGLVLTTLLVPQGMAYAELAGLPAITGLYTTILCLLGYAVFGPSRILVLGPDSSLGPMIAATILPDRRLERRPRAGGRAGVDARADGRRDHDRWPGVAKLGFIADLLSKPTQIGYMNGLALTILVGQLPKLFGFSVDADGLIDEAGGVRRRAGRRARRSRAAVAVGLRQPRADPGAPALAAAGPRRAGRGRARDRRGRRSFDLADHGVVARRGAARGLPAAHHPDVPVSRPRRCWSPARSASRWSR